jgi:hypothetical protein
MSTKASTASDSRQKILGQLADLDTLERGTLAEEYRERLAPDGCGTVRLGPYYKHQCWENGRNLSRRVPAAEVGSLRADLQNAQRFDQLTSELFELAIQEGRARRVVLRDTAEDAPSDSRESKKNFRSRPLPKDTAKPKPSSGKSRRGSGRKA